MKKVQEELPRILIISHTAFKKSDSMGSTLASYFMQYDPDRVAQFYIKNMIPDIPVCRRYYRVTDSELLKRCLHPLSDTPVGTTVELNEKSDSGTPVGKNDVKVSSKNRAAGLIIRNLLWSTNIWNNKAFRKWLDDFDPQVVLVQPGDFAFLLKMATKISVKRNIPLVVHQSEAYYLKPYTSKRPDYFFFRHQFKAAFEKMMKRASLCVYLCDALENDYRTFFDTPSVTVYKSTAIKPKISDRVFCKDNLRFLYGGNLGKAVGRTEPLAELGRAIKQCGGMIDVYTASTGEHLSVLNEENGIRLHNAIPNEELIALMRDSDFVVHVENQSEWHKVDEKYAFSTKIADMLACGCCCIIYGSAEVAGIRYFKENALGCVIEKKEELLPSIRHLIEDSSARETYVEQALRFAKANHNPVKNCQKMNTLICDVVRDYIKK